jgi:phage FluMu protein Com
MTEVHCRHCDKKLADRGDGWFIVDYKGRKIEIFAAGVVMLSCLGCKKSNQFRLTTDERSVKQISKV